MTAPSELLVTTASVRGDWAVVNDLGDGDHVNVGSARTVNVTVTESAA